MNVSGKVLKVGCECGLGMLCDAVWWLKALERGVMLECVECGAKIAVRSVENGKSESC